MRTIDADDLKEELEYYIAEAGWSDAHNEALKWCMEFIDNKPTIEPERKKGKWIHGREMAREMIRDCTTAIFYEGWTCSECGCLVEKEREPWYKYCPNCGSYNGG